LPYDEYRAQQAHHNDPDPELLPMPQSLGHHEYERSVGFHIEMRTKVRRQPSPTRKPSIEPVEQGDSERCRAKRSRLQVGKHHGRRHHQQQPAQRHDVGNTEAAAGRPSTTEHREKKREGDQHDATEQRRRLQHTGERRSGKLCGSVMQAPVFELALA
jgi:hypothetical protein